LNHDQAPEGIRLLYLYGIVPHDAAEPDEVRGIEGAPVRLVRAGGVAGIVSPVPDDAYGEETLNARLADLAWVGERGVAHERVLSWFVDRGPVVPLTPFSLHGYEARVRERLEEGGEQFRATLQRLTGRREWGVRIWRTPAVEAHLDDLSPQLQAMNHEIAAASPGRRYLLERKRATLRAEELRGISARVAREAFTTLARHAEAAQQLPIAAPSNPAAERTLALHAAFLVADTEFAAFEQPLSELVARYRPAGFEWEFTGPWPPYHFVDA
jgi:hypothetical protein